LELMLARHCLLFIVLIICAYTDLADRKIYNWCTLPGVVLGLGVNLLVGGLWDGGIWGANLGSSVAALGLVLVLFGWFYWRGAMAAGDVKLMLAVAAIGGCHNCFILYALTFGALSGALMAVLAFIWHGKLLEGLKGALVFAFGTGRIGQDGERKIAASGITVPFGAAIAIGALIAWYKVELAVLGSLGLLGSA
jgi:Flp pilus assembly protein protease CpaA